MNLSKMCCLCLSNKTELQSIYDLDAKNFSAHEKIKYCKLGTPDALETRKSDLLPFYICKPCICKLQIVFEFKQLLTLNFNKLQEYITQYLMKKKVKPKKIKNPQNNKNEIKYVCDYCKKVFSKKFNLKTHRRSHTNEKPYSCDVCSRPFARSSELAAHRGIHSTVKPFTCTKCNKKFRQQSSLNVHKRVHRRAYTKTNEKLASCELCDGKPFSTAHNLKQHQLLKHSETGRSYMCEVCDKTFVYLSILKTHQLVHTGERNFPCNICKKRFSQAQHLKRHMSVHTNIRPYTCYVCDRNFAQKHHLIKHTQSIHEQI